MSETKKPHLADLNAYWQKMHEEAEEDEKRNEGYVWTIQVGGTSTISNAFVNVDYTLDLNCSHVGRTMYGVYKGELSFKFAGDMSGTKAMLKLLGISTTEDLEGWFRNERFVMRLKPYEENDEKEFIESFDPPKEETEEGKDELTKAATELVNGLLSSFLEGMSVKADAGSDKPSALWYDWDTHMTEGDLGEFLKLNGGMLYWRVSGGAETSKTGQDLHVDEKAVVLYKTINERYDEVIGSPFPYTLKVFDNGKVLFTLHNSNGGPVTVDWLGSIDRIPVEETTQTGR